MSNISNRHNVTLFSGDSKPLTNQRLAKIQYKPRGKNPARFASICVSVPQTEITIEMIQQYAPAMQNIVRDAIQNAQDGIIRSLYESSAGQLSSVSDEEIGIPQCLAYIESVNSGGRLTLESVRAWFDASLRENLTVTIAEKLKFEELNVDQMAVIEKHLNGYRDLFASLASGRTHLNDSQIKSLTRAIEIAADDTEVGEKLVKRLEVMSEKKPIEELLEL